MSNEPLEFGLIGGAEQRPIEIVDYDPQWPELFDAHAAAIAKALGDAALRIEHIGSTAVPGLGAKAIIDVLLVVANSADEPSYLPAMLAAGYDLRVREPDFHEHRMLRTPARDVHIHVLTTGSPEIDRYLVFRDRLTKLAKPVRIIDFGPNDTAQTRQTCRSHGLDSFSGSNGLSSSSSNHDCGGQRPFVRSQSIDAASRSTSSLRRHSRTISRWSG